MEASNVKAMREALENSNGLLEELAAIGEWGESAREQIAENNAALAEPPRNCDVYTHDEALEVWAAENENERNGCFDEWLYHVASEKKGEGK